MRVAIWALGVTLGAVAIAPACVRHVPPPTAPVELAAEPPSASDAGSDGQPGALPLAVGGCIVRLSAGPIETGSACEIDEQISGTEGTLSYPCSGEGPAEAVFRDHRFVGAASHHAVVLELTTELDWDDGCHWETRQTVRGDVREQRLAWSYTERPVRGTGCFPACRAHAELTFTASDVQPP